jgi:hypothetical protein
MFESKSLKSTTPDLPVRKLKIEAHGDPRKGLIKPKIRLTGNWLEQAGFSPGSHVHVLCIGRGVIELRSSDPNRSTATVSDQDFYAASQSGSLKEIRGKS